MFSDGVFAIAVTLLILEVKVPRNLPPDQLLAALAHQWPAWLAFLSSFLSIGIMWLNHHRLFTLIHRCDEPLLFYNLLLLLAITIVPFPTALLAEYIRGPGSRVAGLLYTIHGMIIAVCYTLLWRHAATGNRLLGPRISHDLAHAIFKQYRFGPLLSLGCVGLSLVSPYAAVGVMVALTLFFAVRPAALRCALDEELAT